MALQASGKVWVGGRRTLGMVRVMAFKALNIPGHAGMNVGKGFDGFPMESQVRGVGASGNKHGPSNCQ
ncbi:MAG: hypothetical protein RQ739_16270 [Desulfotignum sp.]|nr:hypothetical protein [Desulfotignum sp.]